MTIYVFAGERRTDETSLRHRQARKSGIEKGLAVFGWGWDKSLDLNNLTDATYLGRTRFLKHIKAGDKIVYTHYSHENDVEKGNHYGECVVMTVVGEQPYSFNDEILEKHGDFANTITIDINSMYHFNRNHKAIHPVVSNSLKPRSSYQRLYAEKEFNDSISNHKNKIDTDYFTSEIDAGVDSIIHTIKRNHPGAKLEVFASNLLQKVYESKYEEVAIRNNGALKGYGSDYGADLIIKYKETNKLIDINGVTRNDFDIDIPTKEVTAVVQVKSYSWEINNKDAIDQCKTAISKYNADYAIIFTTAKMSDDFIEKLKNANDPEKEGYTKPIICISASELIKLFIKYNAN